MNVLRAIGLQIIFNGSNSQLPIQEPFPGTEEPGLSVRASGEANRFRNNEKNYNKKKKREKENQRRKMTENALWPQAKI